MEISPDDVTDWAHRAVEINQILEEMYRASLSETELDPEQYLDRAVQLSRLLARSLSRTANLNAAPPLKKWGYPAQYYEMGISKTDLSVRAADALEKAALLVLSMDEEQGHTLNGYGLTLAEMAAEINLHVSKGEM